MFVKSLSCPWLNTSTIDKFFHFDEWLCVAGRMEIASVQLVYFHKVRVCTFLYKQTNSRQTVRPVFTIITILLLHSTVNIKSDTI